MQLAFGLERGELTVIDVLARIAQHTIDEKEQELQDARSRVYNEAITDTHPAQCYERRGLTIGYIRALLERLTEADDPLRELCSRWAKMLDGRPETRIETTEPTTDE